MSFAFQFSISIHNNTNKMKQTLLVGNVEKNELKIVEDKPMDTINEVSIQIECKQYEPEPIVVPKEVPSWTFHYYASLLTTICCLGPLSIAGLVYFLRARREARGGDEIRAKNTKNKAALLTTAAVLFGVTVTAVVLLCSLWGSPVGSRTTVLKLPNFVPYTEQRLSIPESTSTFSELDIDTDVGSTTMESIPVLHISIISNASPTEDNNSLLSYIFPTMRGLFNFFSSFLGPNEENSWENSTDATFTNMSTSEQETNFTTISNMSIPEPEEAIDFMEPPMQEFEPAEAVDFMAPPSAKSFEEPPATDARVVDDTEFIGNDSLSKFDSVSQNMDDSAEKPANITTDFTIKEIRISNNNTDLFMKTAVFKSQVNTGNGISQTEISQSVLDSEEFEK